MLEGIVLIVLGFASLIVLPFASHRSQSHVARVLFWVALVTGACVIVYSGIETIRSDSELQRLKRRAATLYWLNQQHVALLMN
jgi:threonine/homoserine/homoserine lactone efflux protein